MPEHIVDLHLHSHYSRATSKNCTVEGLYKWGKIKGITVIGTGDFTHPLWLKEMKEKLEPADSGLYKLKDSIAQEIDKTLPGSVRDRSMRYMLTVEISNIYSRGGSLRKVHNLIIVPDFKTAERLNTELNKVGNLQADGRPILGMDSKNLLKLVLDINPRSLFIPAHAWTPWFGIFGSKSGFDSLEEAFGDLTPHIRAIETGLSSDPFMNWRLDTLAHTSIVSFSDAHSPQKLGREATVIECEISYDEIVGAIQTNDTRLKGTIEFFPQEGKYHLDGHRVCNFKCNASRTKELRGICPVCQRPLTIGVDYRVSELADHPAEFKPATHKQVEYIVPLVEIISELRQVGPASKKVQTEYMNTIEALRDEFSILRTFSCEEITKQGFGEVARSIQKMRQGDVEIDPGYDGVYGKIHISS